MEQEITLRDVANYLDNVGIQFLATIGLDGKPVRHSVCAHTHAFQARRSTVENERRSAEIRVVGND